MSSIITFRVGDTGRVEATACMVGSIVACSCAMLTPYWYRKIIARKHGQTALREALDEIFHSDSDPAAIPQTPPSEGAAKPGFLSSRSKRLTLQSTLLIVGVALGYVSKLRFDVLGQATQADNETASRRLQTGEAAARRVVKIDRKLLLAHDVLARNLVAQSRYEEAITELKWLVDHGADVTTRNTLAACLMRCGHLPEAEREYMEVAALSPGKAEPYVKLDSA